ncbi:MAG: hypothetical protein ACRDWT_09720 [Jatrophihabitantaceae bacterium]
MIAEFLWINIPLMALAFALWVGVPMWLVLRHPDKDPGETRTVPGYLWREMANQGDAGERPSADKVRELVFSGDR